MLEWIYLFAKMLIVTVAFLVLFGLGVETVGDLQLARFKFDPPAKIGVSGSFFFLNSFSP